MGLVVESKGLDVGAREIVVPATGHEVQRAAAGQAATIRRRVAEHTAGRIRDLSVAVERRGVVLSGRASTFYSKQLAQVAALQMAGNLPLLNEIEVA